MGSITFTKYEITFALQNKLVLKTFLPTIFINEKVDFKSVKYIFCSDAFLLSLNQQYLNHDTYTDILTFTLSETSLPITSEIYISIPRVKENAEKLNTNFPNELHRVMIHGILHLCGYSDHSPSLKSKMRAREDFYLQRLESST